MCAGAFVKGEGGRYRARRPDGRDAVRILRNRQMCRIVVLKHPEGEGETWQQVMGSERDSQTTHKKRLFSRTPKEHFNAEAAGEEKPCRDTTVDRR